MILITDQKIPEKFDSLMTEFPIAKNQLIDLQCNELTGFYVIETSVMGESNFCNMTVKSQSDVLKNVIQT